MIDRCGTVDSKSAGVGHPHMSQWWGCIHQQQGCGQHVMKEQWHAHVGACAPFGELVVTQTSQHFILQGGDGSGWLVDHVAFVGNVKEAIDEEDEKAGGSSRGSLSRTLGS